MHTGTPSTILRQNMPAWPTEGTLNEDIITLNATPFSNVSSGANETEVDDIIDNKGVQAAFCVLYTLIFVLGLFGNALVCYVVIRNRAMQTVTNLFITNLALSDILLCALAVPFTPLYTFLGKWVFGGFLCQIMPYAQGCSVYISTLTLTSIAIDRFFVIIYPFRPRMKLSTCLWIIVFIWTFSVVVTFPYGYYMEFKDMYCEEKWPSEQFRKVFGALTTIFQFVLPFFIIAFCYMSVSRRLNDRMRTRPGSKNSRKEDAERERKRRTNRMLIAMVAIFGISWLPLNLYNISNDFYETIIQWRFSFLCFFLAHSIAMSSTCYNPFLYAWLNENFRKEFKQVLPCFGSLGGRRMNPPADRLDMYRSEKTCNGNNDTMQDSLITSTMQRLPSIRYRLEFNGSDCTISKNKIDENDDLNSPVSPDDKRANGSPESNDDCVNMYLFAYRSGGNTDERPIISSL